MRKRHRSGGHGGARPNAGRRTNNQLLTAMSKAPSVNPITSMFLPKGTTKGTELTKGTDPAPAMPATEQIARLMSPYWS